MMLLAAVCLGLVTGARTFLAPALLSGYALLFAPDAVIGPFEWLGEWWAFVPLATLALLELWGDKLPRTPSRTQTGGVLARLISGSVTGAAVGGIPTAIAGIAGAAAGAYGCAALRAVLSQRLGSDMRGALVEDALALLGGVLVLTLIL